MGFLSLKEQYMFDLLKNFTINFYAICLTGLLSVYKEMFAKSVISTDKNYKEHPFDMDFDV